MNFLNAITVGLKEIGANKFRSFLTMLGIILGVGSLVAQSALVKGLENGMKETLIAIGGVQKVYITAQEIPAWQKYRADESVGIRMNDVYALQRSAPLIRLVTPEMRIQSNVVTRAGKVFIPWNFAGTWPSDLEMNQHVIEHGRMFNEEDDRLARNVCVVGTGVRDALFGSPEELGRELNPVGEFVNISGQRFRIIGMFQHYQSSLEQGAGKEEKEDPDNSAASGPKRRAGGGTPQGRGGYFEWKNKTIFIPLNTMWLRFRAGAGADGASDPRLSSLEFMVRDMDQMDHALQQVKNVLMSTHNGIEDFSFNTNENWSDNIASAIRNARLTGGIIAAISLLVGGVGIMNIMLASITERVREIGVRKAVGANFIHVFLQILIESVVLAIIGGVAGLLASRGLVKILSLLSAGNDAPVITVEAMLLGFSFSVCVGVLAGLIPAFRAARLHPIQALRYE